MSSPAISAAVLSTPPSSMGSVSLATSPTVPSARQPMSVQTVLRAMWHQAKAARVQTDTRPTTTTVTTVLRPPIVRSVRPPISARPAQKALLLTPPPAPAAVLLEQPFTTALVWAAMLPTAGFAELRTLASPATHSIPSRATTACYARSPTAANVPFRIIVPAAPMAWWLTPMVTCV